MSTEIPSPESAAAATPAVATPEATPPPPPAAPAATLPLSPLAKRAGQFALIGLLINIVANGITRVLDGGLAGASASTQVTIGLVELALLVITRIALIIVIVFALRYAVQALPQTAPGSGYSGRARVIVTFIACGVYILGLIFTVVQLFLIF